MFTIIIQEKGGEQRRMVFNKPEVTIGRVQGNDIVLPKGNVSKRHARIVLKDGKFIIVDLKSTNGTYVNGRKITSPLVVKGSDKIYIGDFILSIEELAAGAGVSPTATAPSVDEAPPPPVSQAGRPRATSTIPPPPPAPPPQRPVAARPPTGQSQPVRKLVPVGGDEGKRARLTEVMRELSNRLMASLDITQRAPDFAADEDLWARAESTAGQLVDQLS